MEVVITRRLANGVVLNAESGDGRFSWFGCEPDVVVVRAGGTKVYCQGLPPRRSRGHQGHSQELSEETLRLAKDFHDMLMPIVHASWRRHIQSIRHYPSPGELENHRLVLP